MQVSYTSLLNSQAGWYQYSRHVEHGLVSSAFKVTKKPIGAQVGKRSNLWKPFRGYLASKQAFPVILIHKLEKQKINKQRKPSLRGEIQDQIKDQKGDFLRRNYVLRMSFYFFGRIELVGWFLIMNSCESMTDLQWDLLVRQKIMHCANNTQFSLIINIIV